MLCTDRLIVNTSQHSCVAISLPCRSWGCDTCAANRRAKLIAIGVAGNPDAFLTLTSRRTTTTTPDRAAAQLARAWRLLRLRITRGKPERDAYKWQAAIACFALRAPPTKPSSWPFASKSKPRPLPFIAVFEATKLGWPHLHILMRSRFIPQWWLATEMSELTGAHIVRIERLKSARQGAIYVAKYLGKNPHRFGTTKRYWRSRDYDRSTKPHRAHKPQLDGTWEIITMPLVEWVHRRLKQGWRIVSNDTRCAELERPP